MPPLMLCLSGHHFSPAFAQQCVSAAILWLASCCTPTSRMSLRHAWVTYFPSCCPNLRHFSRLGLRDRLSALGLTKAFLDFDGSEEAWRRYDKITAREV